MSNHSHEISKTNEKKTLIVIILTIVTMSVEIIYGYVTNSMALLADGFHMGTHALALSLTYTASIVSRKFANSKLFPKGTHKIGTLAAYTSSIFLGFTGIWIIIEAIERLIKPLNINFNDAILVAAIGLLVNAISIVVMEGGHKEHMHENEDYNFKAAYYHILADALTSILAIIALIIGKIFYLASFDSLVGILGGILILKWSISLIKNTVCELIDMGK